MGVREDPYWTLGVAVEAAFPGVWPYLEYTTEQAVNGDVAYGDNTGRITLGVQPRMAGGWALNLALDLGVGGRTPRLGVPATPSHTIFVQIAYGTPLLADRGEEP